MLWAWLVNILKKLYIAFIFRISELKFLLNLYLSNNISFMVSNVQVLQKQELLNYIRSVNSFMIKLSKDSF